MSSSTPPPNQQNSRSPSPLIANSDLSRSGLDSTSNRQYLRIPLRTSHHRPSLDSTYSELSEFSINSTALRHARPLLPPADTASRVHSLSPTRPRRRGMRGYLDAFWLRNKGVVLVLLAMVFGSGMNVAARLMETEGSHGKPMHPFQVGIQNSVTCLIARALPPLLSVPQMVSTPLIS